MSKGKLASTQALSCRIGHGQKRRPQHDRVLDNEASNTREIREAVVRISEHRNPGFRRSDQERERRERHEYQQETPDGGQFRPNRVQVVGVTPMAYLTAWRMAIVQTMLRRGEPLKAIAPAVGYESPTALSRIFAQSTGQSPTKWVARSQRYD